MTIKHHWLTVLIPCICLLVIPTSSAETRSPAVFDDEPVLKEINERNDESWMKSDIEAILNIYGPTSAGYPKNKVTNKPTNHLPYEEMGIDGVEYENIFLDQHFKEPDPELLDIDEKSE